LESEMPATIESLGIDKLPIEERRSLLASLQENIAHDAPDYTLTEAQRADLRERIREADENPDDAVPAEEVHASIRRRLGL